MAEGYETGLDQSAVVQQKINRRYVEYIGQRNSPLFKYYLPQDFNVSDEEVRGFFNVRSDAIKIDAILVERISLADSLYLEIKNGVPFHYLAQKFSLPLPFTQEHFITFGVLTPNIEEAAFSLQRIGETSEPVKADNGFYLINLLDKKPLPKNSFEIEKPKLEKRLLEILYYKNMEQYYTRLYDEYGFQIAPIAASMLLDLITMDQSQIDLLLGHPDAEKNPHNVILVKYGAIQYSVSDIYYRLEKEFGLNKFRFYTITDIENFLTDYLTPDLMYYDADIRNLMDHPEIKTRFRFLKDQVIGDECFKRMVLDKIEISTEEIENRYNQTLADDFRDKNTILAEIKNEIFNEKKSFMAKKAAQKLYPKFEIEYNSKAITNLLEQLNSREN